MHEDLLNTIFPKEAKIISPLVGGMMNQSYIVSCDDKKYVLYISTKQANEMVDRELERKNQQLIISLGLTSKNIYFDTKNGIKVNEYIEGSSLDKIQEYDYHKIAILLKTMHQSGLLSEQDYGPFKRFIDYENEASSFQKLEDEQYVLLRQTLFENKDFLENQKKVLCHNDAQRSNIIKSSDNKYYLIDFEFMGNNDPIYDIATFGNGTVKEGFHLLNEYYDNNPSKEACLRYYLWRIFISLQWHNVAIVKHYHGEGKTHGFDFLKVAEFFLNNALDAYQGLKDLN